MELRPGASHAQGHGGAPQMPGQNLPASRGGACVDFKSIIRRTRSPSTNTMTIKIDRHRNGTRRKSSLTLIRGLVTAPRGRSGLKFPTLEGEGERYLPLKVPWRHRREHYQHREWASVELRSPTTDSGGEQQHHRRVHQRQEWASV